MTETSGFATVTGADSQVQDTSSQGQESTAGESFQQPNEQQETSSGGGHPAWNDILQKLPAGLHEMIRPELEKWDRGVQERFQQVQSRYEPYKDFVENEVDPQDIQRAMQVYQLMNQNPQMLWEQMGRYYNFAQQQASNSGQGQQESVEEYDLDESQRENVAAAEGITPEKLQQLEQNQQILAKALYQKYEQEQQAQADAELEQELSRLREEFGEFDEEFVIPIAAQTGDVEAAVKKYMELKAKIAGNPRPGSNLPRPIQPGGATPSTSVNPAELDSKDTRNLVVEFLKSRQG